jgi:CSLREA domain-containing protein
MRDLSLCVHPVAARLTALFLCVTLLFCLVAFGLLGPISVPTARAATTIIVTSAADTGANTLRQAVADATNGDTIDFNISPATPIYLTSGEILIKKDITILGDGAAITAISGSGLSRVFNITGTVTISGVKISDGTTASYGGGINVAGGSLNLINSMVYSSIATNGGGGIYVLEGSLLMDNVYIISNTAASGGGAGIYNSQGNVTLVSSTVISNTAKGTNGGGGIASNGGGVTLSHTDVMSNISVGVGGGIYFTGGTLDILDESQISYNVVENHGGGLAIFSNYGATQTTRIENSTIAYNQIATDYRHGGGIYHLGNSNGRANLFLDHTTILANSASFAGGCEGGGIYNAIQDATAAAAVSIHASTILSNTAKQRAGGLLNNGGAVVISHSVIAGNSAVGGFTKLGGGIFNTGILTMTNSTLSGNTADLDGGGLYDASTTPPRLDNVTIADNQTLGGDGGGIYLAGTGIRLRNTIIGDNQDSSTANDCETDGAAFVLSSGYNLLESTPDSNCSLSGTGDITGQDPALGSLGDHGGPTWTQPLQSGSPAIDTGACTDLGGATVAIDQRYMSRQYLPGCDMGAYEFAVITVNDTQDVFNPSDGKCSLREAVTASNDNASSGSVSGECPPGDSTAQDQINFSVTGAIVATSGPYTISAPAAVYGPGTDVLALSGNDNSRIFDVASPSGDVLLANLTLRDGWEANAGGAIACTSTLVISRCAVVDNYSFTYGGAIYNHSTGNMTIVDSTVSGNTARNGGSGGIHNSGAMAITNSTVSGNSTDGHGGGIGNYDDLSISHSSIVSNTADARSSTGSVGGGLYTNSNDTTHIRATILANNRADTTYNDCHSLGATTSYDYNLVEIVGTCTFSQSHDMAGELGADLNIGPLADNGGPTWTHALLNGCPAIDAGACTDLGGATAAIDQRGTARPQSEACDIGAFEADDLNTFTFLPITLKQ